MEADLKTINYYLVYHYQFPNPTVIKGWSLNDALTSYCKTIDLVLSDTIYKVELRTKEAVEALLK